VDLSALIFVALAVAWAVYLVPKALRHHEVDRVSRTVDSFSDRVRVLARRDAVAADKAALVVDRPSSATTPAAAAPDPVAGATDEPAAVPPAHARRAAARKAARRRRRVLGQVLLANAVVAGLAGAAVIGWVWVAIPAALLVGWLVACRLMVRKERKAGRVRKGGTTLAGVVPADDADDTGEIPVADADDEQPADPNAWDPVPITLPTYVAKAPAGRTVRTIDLDSTGVWSSGRNASDSALAREAEQRATEAAAEAEPKARRASGA
jgi:hypothetical protein